MNKIREEATKRVTKMMRKMMKEMTDEEGGLLLIMI